MSFTPETALEYLRRAEAGQRLAHAYLISGPAGSGKSELAANFAATLNGSTSAKVLSGAATDVVLTEPASRSRRIVIEQIRNLERALQLRVANGRRKIGIIRDADRMQPQAANAFLKTLEEPPANSLLLLLTSLPEALPDTIVSRCLPLALRSPAKAERSTEENELLELLCANAHGVGGPSVQTGYKVAQGIQHLLEKIRDDVRTEHGEALRAEEQRYRTTTDGAWLDEREDFYKALTESVYRERRTHLLEMLFVWWAAVLRQQVQAGNNLLPDCAKATQNLAKQVSSTEVLTRLRWLEEMRDQLNTTAQEALVIEVACLRVFG